MGISKLTSVSSLGGKHVEFVSVDRCKVRFNLIHIAQIDGYFILFFSIEDDLHSNPI